MQSRTPGKVENHVCFPSITMVHPTMSVQMMMGTMPNGVVQISLSSGSLCVIIGGRVGVIVKMNVLG